MVNACRFGGSVMASFQKTYPLGNVTRDVELRYTPTGTPVADLSIAVNRTWKGDNGEKHEETTFFDCTAWGRTAEIASEYLRKGSPIFVEGHFQSQSWQDRETGKKRSKLVLIIENLQLLGGKPEQNRPPNQPAAPKQSAPPSRTQPKPEPSESPSKPAGVSHNEFGEPDDIPFRTTIYRDVKKSRLSRRFVQ
jgi:single-strand DNA-binding protein